MGFESSAFARKVANGVRLRKAERKVLHTLALVTTEPMWWSQRSQESSTALPLLQIVALVSLIHDRRPSRASIPRVASAAPAASLCAGHVQQLGGGSPPANLMEVKA